MTSGKSIKDILKNGINILNNAGIESANIDARALLRHILGKDSIYIDIHRDDILSEDIIEMYYSFIKRRSENEPYAYIVNSKEFMSLDFYVDKNVLIPRPDTEILVEYIINHCNSSADDFKIIDLCTGSGAIAVSLAHYIDRCTVDAVDISENAIRIAKKNSSTHNTADKISFSKFDVLSDISKLGKYDVIVSNPPYIRKNDVLNLESDVKDFEPVLALDGGDDGLIFYRNIIAHLSDLLNENGIIAFEIGFDQANDVINIFNSYSYTDTKILKDYSGNDRVVIAKI